MIDISILDQSVRKISEELEAMAPTVEDLEALLEAEQNGKTRAGAIALLGDMIDAANKPVEAAPPANTITNTRKGFTLHLGDGRSVSYGETVEVPACDVAFLQGVIDG